MGYKFDDDLYQGSNHQNAKLTEDIVREARASYRAAQVHIMGLRKKYSIASYAKKYGVNFTTMERALSGETWADPSKSIKCYNSKLSEEIVAKVRAEHAAAQIHIKDLRKKQSIKSYAEKYGVFHTTMGNALFGRTWTHV